jgi:polyhydroxyalkanoate synthase
MKKPTDTPLSDRRFAASEWQQWPYRAMAQSFLAQQQWWQEATTGIKGLSSHQTQLLSFSVRQVLDMFSPSNFLWSNPEAQHVTVKTGGANLLQGLRNRREDALRLLSGGPVPGTENFRPGHEVAMTPGKVVFRNHLMELIQYTPQTATVFAAPVLIVPSWILKFYILDLSPQNSMVKYLVEQGHTVFIVSWKNPDASDRDVGMDTYLKSGVMGAIDAVCDIMPNRKVQAVGYCLGGTLLAMAAAYMARRHDDRLSSLTLLASELDFTEPGELGLFIDDAQLALLDQAMSRKGYLDGKQMAGAFALLNSRDLVWSRMEREYLLGKRQKVNDLAAWNADTTRMPYRQHSEYLHRLYLNNDLAAGRCLVDGIPISLADIRLPVFALGTVRDTVSPWQSVYKVHLLMHTEITFCLTSGGHNAGIVNPPGPDARHSYQMAVHGQEDCHTDPSAWIQTAPSHEGSWWLAWKGWLQTHSGKRGKPPAMGGTGHTVLDDAPGSYVLKEPIL